MTYTVHIGYDEADKTDFVLSSDIPRLNVETQSFEPLVDVTQDALPDLVCDNAIEARVILIRQSHQPWPMVCSDVAGP